VVLFGGGLRIGVQVLVALLACLLSCLLMGRSTTYAYARAISAQDTDLQAVDDRVEVLGLGLERGFGVELLRDRRVGLGGDLGCLELLGHVEFET